MTSRVVGHWVMYCIVFCAEKLAWKHKLKRKELNLWFCDGVGDFGSRRFCYGGSKVIGSSE